MNSDREETCEICGRMEYAFILRIPPKGVCQDCCIVPDHIPGEQVVLFINKKKLKAKNED